MYNFIRVDPNVTSFSLFPPDMLLYYKWVGIIISTNTGFSAVRQFQRVNVSIPPHSYSLVPQASCRSYFQQLAEADFFVFSNALRYKRDNLLVNARRCLVSSAQWQRKTVFICNLSRDITSFIKNTSSNRQAGQAGGSEKSLSLGSGAEHSSGSVRLAEQGWRRPRWWAVRWAAAGDEPMIFSWWGSAQLCSPQPSETAATHSHSSSPNNIRAVHVNMIIKALMQIHLNSAICFFCWWTTHVLFMLLFEGIGINDFWYWSLRRNSFVTELPTEKWKDEM